MYIKYKDYNGQKLLEGQSILMSHDEFVTGGKDLKDVPLTITKDGSEPLAEEDMSDTLTKGYDDTIR